MSSFNFFWGGWWIFPIFMIIMCIIMCSFFFKRGRNRSFWCMPFFDYDEPANRNDHESPIELLKKRYVKGEITKEEFEQIKKDILS